MHMQLVESIVTKPMTMHKNHSCWIMPFARALHTTAQRCYDTMSTITSFYKSYLHTDGSMST